MKILKVYKFKQTNAKVERNIKNSKDPTIWRFISISTNSTKSTILFLLTFIMLINLNVSHANSMGELRLLDGQFIRNVSCIFHDIKYTCDCQNVPQNLYLPNLPGNVFQVEVRNCQSLTVNGHVLENTLGLRKISFKNIQNLILNKYAISFSRHASNTPYIIEFEEVNIELIDSLAIIGNIQEISFIGGQINVIHPFGLTILEERALLFRMHKVKINRLDAQAFKKFAVEQMEITDCIFTTNVPSKTFYEIVVFSTLFISNCQFKEIHSHAFSFRRVSKLIIEDNRFTGGIDGEWIEVQVLENVIIRSNYFGLTSPIAFKAINIHRDYLKSERLEILFDNNTVRSLDEARPFEFNERFSINIKQLRYENYYDCNDLDLNVKPPQPTHQFFQTYRDSIYLKPSYEKDTTFMNNHPNNNKESFIIFNSYIKENCNPTSYTWYIVVGILIIVFIIISLIIIICVVMGRRRKKRQMKIIMPETRTYKETQIVYQIENAGLLRTDM